MITTRSAKTGGMTPAEQVTILIIHTVILSCFASKCCFAMLSSPLSRSVPRSLASAALRCPEDFGDAVWRADSLARAAGTTVASGHAVLDAELPGGGWPVGAMSEILQVHSGQHEWRLLLPALIKPDVRGRTSAPVVLVGAPHKPFGPGLHAQGLDARRLLCVHADRESERLWATEQALRCAAVSAVLAWLPQVRADALRRLQMAALSHQKLLFVMRPAQAQADSSPAVLRLLIGSAPPISSVWRDDLQVQVLKRRGPPLVKTLLLAARPARLAVLMALAPQPTEEAHALDCPARVA